VISIIAAIITGGCTLAGVVVTNELQLRRQTRQLQQPESAKETKP
jgi:hypothetical protein